MSDPAYNIARCKWCGAGIIWLKYEKTGNPAPIDAEPVQDGNVIINRAKGTWALADMFTAAEHEGDLHMNHWATCPEASKHRGKGGKS